MTAKVSIVIPCYNGERVIESSLNKLMSFLESSPSAFRGAEVIVVDDGSSDRTAAIVEERFPWVRLLRMKGNCGKGAAVRHGMLQAKGEYRFFTDADMPFDLSVLPKMLAYLDDKEFHVCIGSRNGSNVKTHTKRSLSRIVGSALFTTFVTRVVVTGVQDTQCGLKGFRGEVADFLFRVGKIEGFAFDVELLYLAFKNDLDIKRIPVRLVSEDESTINVLKHGPLMMCSILALPMRYYLRGYPKMKPPADSP